MALNLTRPKQGSLSKQSVVRLLSSSSKDPFPPPSAAADGGDDRKPQSSLSSYFNDVKASLKQPPQPPPAPPQQQGFNPNFVKSSFTNPSTPPQNSSSLDDIRKSLSQYKSRSPPKDSGSQQQQPPLSFQEMYKRNVSAKSNGAESSGPQSSGFAKGGNQTLTFDSIRESLRQMRAKNPPQNPENRNMSLSALKNTLKEKPNSHGPGFRSNLIGGVTEVPMSIFQKESLKKEEGGKEGEVKDEMKIDFFRIYSHSELGKKLSELRPDEAMKQWEKGEGEWSWLEELNERLVKLRKLEEEESVFPGASASLKQALVSMKMSENDENNKKRTAQINRIGLLNKFGVTPSFMKLPAQDHLVEKYLHPDNMSSAEKMKLELQKVKDEFKMSESDCGSARVQVAQLTTKINHLATALHKKDKHSRKGLQEMVVKRKKLLKYLRRTDWDSYTYLLSRLKLRDNPDYKL